MKEGRGVLGGGDGKEQEAGGAEEGAPDYIPKEVCSNPGSPHDCSCSKGVIG